MCSANFQNLQIMKVLLRRMSNAGVLGHCVHALADRDRAA